jgi:hypothetical protein
MPMSITTPYAPLPQGWKPHQSHLGASTAARLDGRTHPVSNPTAPGFAYGTVKPLTSFRLGMVYGSVPYIRPVTKTYSLQVPMKPQLQGVTPNYSRALNIPGAIGYVPGQAVDVSSLNAIQQKLAQIRQ